jgi:plasmid stability protein
MAQIIVRNLEDEVKERLAQRARRHGRSMEAEVRDILRNAVREALAPEPETDFGTRLRAFFEKHGFHEEEIEEFKGELVKPATFD